MVFVDIEKLAEIKLKGAVIFFKNFINISKITRTNAICFRSFLGVFL